MKAAVAHTYGPPDVLKMATLEKPRPADNEILVKVKAAGVTSGDARVRGLNVPTGFGLLTRLMFGFSKPKNPVLGMDFAGTVESAGKNVTTFQKGDSVFGASEEFGSYAEYLIIPEEKAVAQKPGNLTFAESAALPFGALASLVYLRDFGKLKKGQHLLVNGASGSLGTYAVQIGKYFGTTVTGVCSTSNIELVQSLGADHVINYTREDVTQSAQKYDIIFDTVGKLSFSDCKHLLTDEGRFLMAVAGIPQFLQVLWTSIMSRKKAVAGVVTSDKEDLKFIRELVESNQLRPVIDKRYKLEEIANAHRYVETGHKRGNVVVIIDEHKSEH